MAVAFCFSICCSYMSPSLSSSTRRGRQSVLAVWRVLQHGRRLSGSHFAPPQVPRPLPPLLGQRQPREPGNVLRACGGAASLQESAGPRQQHPDLCRPSCGVPRGQEERTGYSWHHSVDWRSRRSYIPCLSLHEEETDYVLLKEPTSVWVALGLKWALGGTWTLKNMRNLTYIII